MNRATQAQRYVVARHAHGGIGDHLSCLIGAWWYARQTGRTLVVDWRGSRFNDDATHRENCFFRIFEITSPMLAGVPLLPNQETIRLDWLHGPFFPGKWTHENLCATDHVGHTDGEIAEINQLVADGSARPEPTVAINQWISPHPPKAAVRQLLVELCFNQRIRAEADGIWARHPGDGQAIAVHIRHGNGENIGVRAAYWLGPLRLWRQLRQNRTVNLHRTAVQGRFSDNMAESLIGTDRFCGSEARFLDRVAKCIALMRRKTPGARVMLFCDSAPVAGYLASKVANLVVPPKTFLPASAGPLHALVRDGKPDTLDARKAATRDMLIELELMRRCSALICMDSGFSIVSRTLLESSHLVLMRPPALNRLLLRALA